MRARSGAVALRLASRRGLATKPQSQVDALTVPGEFDRLHNLLPYKAGGRNSNNGIVATVFGATGLVGRYVVPELAINGSQCIVPFRGDGLNTRTLKLGGDLGQVVPVPYDLFDPSSIQRALDGSNVAINLVGSAFDTRAQSLHDANVKTAYRIAKFAKEAGVKRFVQMSTTQAAPDAKSEWARLKYEAETIVRDFHPESIIIRATDIYGDGDKFVHKFARIAHFTGRNLASWDMVDKKIAPVWAGDVARAIALSLVDADAPGTTYELAGASTFTWREFFERIAERTYMETNNPVVSVPDALLQPLAAILAKVPADYKLVSPDMLLRWASDNLASKGSKGFKDLGHEPSPFEREGYNDLIYFDQTASKVGWSYMAPEPRIERTAKFTKDGDYSKDTFPRRYRIKYSYMPQKELSRL